MQSIYILKLRTFNIFLHFDLIIIIDLNIFILNFINKTNHLKILISYLVLL